MLFQAPRLAARDEAVLDLIRGLWVELRHSLERRPLRWTGLLARNLRAKAIQGSNSIEGYVVSDEAALAALEGERPEDTDEVAWINVVHYREAMDYVVTLADDEHFAYSSRVLKSLHYLMMRHRRDKHPGLWRPGAIYVRNEATGEVVYEGPPAADVGELVEELCAELTELDGETPTRMIRAALAHLNLVMIHPFSDGNGRMARCLQTLVLARGGVLPSTFSSIEEHLGRNTPAYYDVLAQVGQGSWHPQNDTLAWVRFCLTAHYRQAVSVKRRLDRMAAICEQLEQEFARRGLPERAVSSVANAALGFRIRNETYRQEADVSTASATRDLRVLSEAGIVVAQGQKRGRYYAASDWLRGLAARHTHKAAIVDPYALV